MLSSDAPRRVNVLTYANVRCSIIPIVIVEPRRLR